MQERGEASNMGSVGRAPRGSQRPPLGAREVLVEVRRTAGAPTARRGPRANAVAAGRVVAVGPRVKGLWMGRDVLCRAPRLLEAFAVAPAAAAFLRPERVGDDEALELLRWGVPALHAVRDVARLRAGQQALLIGASRPMGRYVVRVARAFGVEVTAVCPGREVGALTALGVSGIIDEGYFREAPLLERYDAVLTLGELRAPRDTVRDVLAPGGVWLRLVDGASTLDRVWARVCGRRICGHEAPVRPGDLETLAHLLSGRASSPSS